MTSQTPPSETMATVTLSSGIAVKANMEDTRVDMPYFFQFPESPGAWFLTTEEEILQHCRTFDDVRKVESLTAAPSALSSEVESVLQEIASIANDRTDARGFVAKHTQRTINVSGWVATLRSALSRSSQETAGVPTREEIAKIAYECGRHADGYTAAGAILALFQRSPQPSAPEDSTTELTPEIRTAFELTCEARMKWTKGVLDSRHSSDADDANRAAYDTALLALVNVCREGR